ncbi:branched-chain amino acid aminotransferase [Actinokineospora auranticolor]|uniref:branched-chain amino acid aminotransferase n=1 Tax=Actinokineospora auranticolor TaxID=155976 RepID=UPI001FEB8703|nr:branched-chain amino acid aminotransferase [Actinokineospora auranticolor]
MTTFRLDQSDNVRTKAERDTILADPRFGTVFTDHMATAVWTEGDGWRDHTVGPLRPFSVHPAAAVLHYAQEVFEGLKAYRHADGSVWLFRADANAERFQRSARRLALPELDTAAFLDGIEQLVRVDADWVPAPDGEKSLYLRPFMFATEPFIGVRPAREVTYCLIASPVGSYFPSGPTGVNLWVTDEYVRAAPGGTGEAKCGGNYAAGLAAQLAAQENDCDQVLFVDAVEREWLEESGTMNVFVVTRDGELVTPGLGTILAGVTRGSVLALAEDHGLTPVQRRIGVGDLRAGCADGSITEIFAAGTAAVITPIIGLRGKDFDLTVGTGKPGERTLALREHLLDIQFGRAADTRGWLRRVV